MSKISFLFCCDFFDKSQPDNEYAEEYFYAKTLGLPVYLFCLETFLESGKITVAVTDKPVALIYRGWIITIKQYDTLYNLLLDKGYHLINRPEQYQQCHHLPNWYKILSNHTARSVWTQGIPVTSERIKLLRTFGDTALLVKDYVKSRKHEWESACYIPNAADVNQAMQVIENFIAGQDDELIGGIVLREYLPLTMLGKHEKSHMPIAKEVRVFCYRHKPFAYIQYWSGDESHTVTEYQNLLDLCHQLDSHFYTVDLAQRENGEWVIIEVGDGQVSGLQGYSVSLFYDGLCKTIASCETNLLESPDRE